MIGMQSEEWLHPRLEKNQCSSKRKLAALDLIKSQPLFIKCPNTQTKLQSFREALHFSPTLPRLEDCD